MSDTRHQLASAVLPVKKTPSDEILSFFRHVFGLNEEGVFSVLTDDFLYQVFKSFTLQEILNFMLVSKYCKTRIDAFDEPLFAFRLKASVLTKVAKKQNPVEVSSLRHLYLFRNTKHFLNGVRRDELYAIAISHYKVCEFSDFAGVREIIQKPKNTETIEKSLQQVKRIYLFNTKAKALAKLKAYRMEDADPLRPDFAHAYPLLLVRLSNSSILDFVHNEFRKKGTKKVVMEPEKLSEMELISGEFYSGEKDISSFPDRVILHDLNKKIENCTIL